jgi:hypothetical protein
MEKTPHPPVVSLDTQTLIDAFSGESDIDLLAQSLCPQIAFDLVEHFAGLQLPIPKTIYWDHPIAEALGFEAAQALVSYAEGGVLYIPSHHPVRRVKIKLQIETLIKRGMSRPTIALCLGISDRHVRRLTHEMGLSGVSNVPTKGRSGLKGSQSKSNGGLTGGVAEFATPHQSTP